MKVKTILVNLESYLYLRKRMRVERGCEINETWEQFIIKEFNRNALKCGNELFKEIADYDLGGGIGEYDRGWTSWSIKDIQLMLDKQKLNYSFNEAEQIRI